MPTYKFKNRKTGDEFTEFMKISELDPYKEANPDLEQVPNGAPLIAYRNLGSEIKVDGGFKEVLQKAAEAHPLSPLADRYMKKTAKQLKTEEVVKKHRRRSGKT
jgi:hypothetical protein